MGQPLRLLLVEDEFITLDLLRDTVLDLGYAVAADAMSAEEALRVAPDCGADLGLLDIHLERPRAGIELACALEARWGIPSLFLTAHGDAGTIAAAMAAEPLGYLVKPFRPVDVHAAIAVAAERLRARAAEAPPGETPDLILRDQETFVRVRLGEIRYVEAFRNYLEVNTRDAAHVIRSTLKDFADELPAEDFFQPHRSFLVNARHVTALEATGLRLGDAEVPVSRSRRQAVREFFARR